MEQQDYFLFTFVTPEKKILDSQKVAEILCPSQKGELNILPGHAPLIALLKPGVLSWREQNQWTRLAVSWGYLEVHPKGARVLAETACAGREVSKIKIEESLNKLRQQLKNPLLKPDKAREIKREMENQKARLLLFN